MSSYRVLFSRRARKSFLDLPKEAAEKVRQALEALAEDPRRPGTIKLANAPLASYRHRVGAHRILFDIDDERNEIQVYDIVRRDERTYRRR